MATGTVKWFNASKAYGFIRANSGCNDVCAQITAAERASLTSVRLAEKLSERSLALAAKIIALGALSCLLTTEAYSANCSIPYFNFNITSQGPWPASMTVKSGANCGSRYWSINTFTAKMLYIAVPPQHGKISLSAPGGYSYSASPGYIGSDTFTLKLCGTKFGGYEGCADILFRVSVVASM